MKYDLEYCDDSIRYGYIVADMLHGSGKNEEQKFDVAFDYLKKYIDKYEESVTNSMLGINYFLSNSFGDLGTVAYFSALNRQLIEGGDKPIPDCLKLGKYIRKDYVRM